MNLLSIIEKSIDCLYAIMPRPKPSKDGIEQCRIIAHRGAHQKNKYIENTIPAFDEALRLGCWGIELDIQETKDGELVVNHDPTLKRLWQQNISITEVDFQALHQKAPQIPRLKDVIERYGKKLHLFIEIKTPLSNENHLADLLKTLTPCKNYHLISLEQYALKTLNLFPKKALLLVSELTNSKNYVQESIVNDYGGVLGHYLLIKKSYAKQLKDNNQIVGVGFIDSKYNLYRTLNRKITYIFTNEALTICKQLNAIS